MKPRIQIQVSLAHTQNYFYNAFPHLLEGNKQKSSTHYKQNKLSWRRELSKGMFLSVYLQSIYIFRKTVPESIFLEKNMWGFLENQTRQHHCVPMTDDQDLLQGLTLPFSG